MAVLPMFRRCQRIGSLLLGSRASDPARSDVSKRCTVELSPQSDQAIKPPAPPEHKAPERKSINDKPFKHFLRAYVPLNAFIVLMGMAGNIALADPYVQFSSYASGPLAGVLVPIVFLVEVVILLFHVVSTCWFYVWWPFRGTLIWYGVGGLILLRCYVCAGFFQVIMGGSMYPCGNPAAATGALTFWLILSCSLVVFLWFHRTFVDQNVRTPAQSIAAELDAKRQWATTFVREKFTKDAEVIYPHYTEADLQQDLHHSFGSPSRLTDLDSIHAVAKALVSKIDGYRAYEHIRHVHLQEAQRPGGAVSWARIEQELDSLLSANLSLIDIRRRETRLEARVRQLSEWHRTRAESTDQREDASTEDHIEAAIAAEVRADASPADSEEEIEREIAHRLRGFRERCAA